MESKSCPEILSILQQIGVNTQQFDSGQRSTTQKLGQLQDILIDDARWVIQAEVEKWVSELWIQLKVILRSLTKGRKEEGEMHEVLGKTNDHLKYVRWGTMYPGGNGVPTEVPVMW